MMSKTVNSFLASRHPRREGTTSKASVDNKKLLNNLHQYRNSHSNLEADRERYHGRLYNYDASNGSLQ